MFQRLVDLDNGRRIDQEHASFRRGLHWEKPKPRAVREKREEVVYDAADLREALGGLRHVRRDVRESVLLCGGREVYRGPKDEAVRVMARLKVGSSAPEAYALSVVG